jgi:hypothetical protein
MFVTCLDPSLWWFYYELHEGSHDVEPPQHLLPYLRFVHLPSGLKAL